jgi:hypothetical protein
MVLGMNRLAVLPRIERNPVRHGPRDRDAIPLQAEVPVKPPSMVFLHHEPTRTVTGRPAGRFRGLGEIALVTVRIELSQNEIRLRTKD